MKMKVTCRQRKTIITGRTPSKMYLFLSPELILLKTFKTSTNTTKTGDKMGTLIIQEIEYLSEMKRIQKILNSQP